MGRAGVAPTGTTPWVTTATALAPGGRSSEGSVDTFRPTCLHPAMPLSEPLTRRRAVDLLRVATALCRTTG
ncbi:putative leader peptide [Streptomyces sp. NPDC020794]|uniref:putative leader peptide n=1 Tax=Streptomyces sp. NPDC020794 TaxID=3365090 RepID=UPI00378DC8A9